MRDPRWRDEAACKGMDPGIFVMEQPGRGSCGYAEAKEVCAGCPCKRDCLAFALEMNEQIGVYGGTTPTERRKLRRQKSR